MTDIVTKSSIIHGIYTNFYDILSAISATGPGNIFAERIYPSMPDIELGNINSYPILILESPEIDLNQFSFGKNVTNGRILLNIYATSAKTRDQIADKVIYAVETNKDTLAEQNLRQVNIDTITSDQIARGKIKVHYCMIPIKFQFYSDKTFAF